MGQCLRLAHSIEVKQLGSQHWQCVPSYGRSGLGTPRLARSRIHEELASHLGLEQVDHAHLWARGLQSGEALAPRNRLLPTGACTQWSLAAPMQQFCRLASEQFAHHEFVGEQGGRRSSSR